jgi:hypothetical protein
MRGCRSRSERNSGIASIAAVVVGMPIATWPLTSRLSLFTSRRVSSSWRRIDCACR